MGAVVADIDPGRSGSKVVGTFFKGNETGSVVVQGRNVGTNHQDGSVP